MNRPIPVVFIALIICVSSSFAAEEASEADFLIGGCGGAYFLAEPGELVIDLEKRDRNRGSQPTELRAILVGPDRENKRDNHSNKVFAHEGDELRAFVAGRKNMVVVCGDRHWQYVSVHPGSGVREYSCGPVSDKHAGGWTNDQRYREHRYLNVTGGFLAVTVDRSQGRPMVMFRHHAVDGGILNEDRFTAQ